MHGACQASPGHRLPNQSRRRDGGGSHAGHTEGLDARAVAHRLGGRILRHERLRRTALRAGRRGGRLASRYGLWVPSGTDTCTPAIHDSYSTVGPDGLRYPTWHPPVDPATGCTFGHEHGRDPSGSALFAEVGADPVRLRQRAPRGERLRHAPPRGPRRPQGRVGEPACRCGSATRGTATFAISCDVLTKLHQGTHSPDAFTNNMHEVVYHVRCTDGTAFSATLLTPIGTPGELVASCDRERHVTVGHGDAAELARRWRQARAARRGLRAAERAPRRRFASAFRLGAARELGGERLAAHGERTDARLVQSRTTR